MVRSLFLSVVFAATISFSSVAQNIGTDEPKLVEKLSRKMSSQGFSNKVIYDTASKTFNVETSKKYMVVFAFKASLKGARRFIVYQLNEDGSHKKSFTSKSSKGYRDGGAQVFTLNLRQLPADETALKMKVDARPAGKVYVYSN